MFCSLPVATMRTACGKGRGEGGGGDILRLAVHYLRRFAAPTEAARPTPRSIWAAMEPRAPPICGPPPPVIPCRGQGNQDLAVLPPRAGPGEQRGGFVGFLLGREGSGRESSLGGRRAVWV